ncbi:MAG TPA: preprotein translocase subunit SecG [Candidatus Paceibacterota bacterium]|nr:preprotein translocase subunit SecG [Candidatus Paceibacterota bacterium]
METIITFLPWIQIALSALLIGVILIQQSEAGISGNMGGGQHRTKRGLEKGIFIGTIVIAILFAASALLAIAYSSF